jgi:hypothetical protein
VTCPEKDVRGLAEELTHVCSESAVCTSCKMLALTMVLAKEMRNEFERDGLDETLSTIGIINMNLCTNLNQWLDDDRRRK